MIRHGVLAACLLVSVAWGCDEAVADEVVLTNGDVLSGTVLSDRAGESVRMRHDVLGELALPRTAVLEVRRATDAPPAAQPDLPVVIEAAQELPVVAPAAEAAPVEDPWSFEIGVASSAAGGNSDIFDFKIDAEAVYERDPWLMKIGGAYVYGESDGERSVENWHGLFRLERKLGKCTYSFLQVHYDRNVLADLQHRFSTVAGVGTVLAENRYAWLKGEVGGGFTHERRFGLSPVTDPAAYAGLEYQYEGSDGTTLRAKLDFLPNLSDFDLTLTTFDARFDVPLCKELSLSLGVRLDHVVNPPGDVESLDSLFDVGLRAKF